ncbi:magnesium transporter CorA family protein [Candidatus Micrarchaeota archaeon]|nr:magnesium transporter CorA family protein [Candidatus Micrarchaeota archaeon]
MKALLLDGCGFSNETAAKLAKKRVWADFGAHEADLLSAFGISAEERRKNEQRQYPRYIEHEKFTSIVFFEAQPHSEKRRRLHIYLGKGFVATVGCESEMDGFYQNYVKEKGISRPSFEDVVFYVLSSAAYKNSEIIQTFEDGTNRLEDEAHREQGSKNLGAIFSLKRKLVRFNKFFWRQRELVFELKSNQVAFFQPDAVMKSKLDELFNSILFDINSIETLREILSDTLDLHHTLISNRINNSIKRLTVITVVLAIVATVSVIPNTLATIFGIPYFPWKADVPVLAFNGVDIYPWEAIISLIAFFSIAPAVILFYWWKGYSRNEQ